MAVTVTVTFTVKARLRLRQGLGVGPDQGCGGYLYLTVGVDEGRSLEGGYFPTPYPI